MKEVNILKINNNCLVVFNGKKIHTNNMTDASYNKLLKYKNALQSDEITDQQFEDFVTNLMSDDLNDTERYLTQHEDRSDSIVTKRGNSYYLLDVSELTIPLNLVEKIYQAEDCNNQELLQTYKNFWTLVSLNPDSRVRNDIFWFIQRWDIKISKSGLLIMYRNVDIADEDNVKYSTQDIQYISQRYDHIKHVSKKNPENYDVWRKDDDYDELVVAPHSQYNVFDYDYTYEGTLKEVYNDIINNSSKVVDNIKTTPTYTDHYSHKFKIKIGEIVSMPREKCDPNQSCSCSKGLHCASKDWLKKNYFGDLGLKVLVNPADIVACPTIHDYNQEGKLRTCAYYPFSTITYDKLGDIDDDISTDGIEYASECDFINKIAYTGIVNNEDIDNYSLPIPSCVELNREQVYENLIKLAKQFNHNV